MSTDRSTKALLAIIAAALWMIAIWPTTSPETAAAGQVGTTTKAHPPQATGRAAERLSAGPATLPITWHVPYAMFDSTSIDTHCATAIMISNPTPGTISTEIEYFASATGYSLGYASVSVDSHVATASWLYRDPGGGPYVYVDTNPFISDHIWHTVVDEFAGYASVHSNDPRIIVTAYMVCRDGLDVEAGAKIVGMANIPTYPAHSALEYYRAASPGRPALPGVVTPDPR
jgi:hypothetical protein